MEINPAKRKGPIFISYARSDSACCEKIKNALEKAGIDCWRDTDDIKPGEKWLKRLQEALKQAQAMIVLCSKASEKSDYMELEFHEARELKLSIIPVIIEGQDVPFHLKDRNVIFLGDDWNAGINRLIRCFYEAPTQRQAELDWLQALEQQLQNIYTPLAGESRQSPKKQVSVPQNMVQHALLEHLARHYAKDLPEQKREYEDIQSAFSQVSRVVLLGEPGAGKSTTLRKLAGDSIGVALTDPEAPIPLFISLGEWRDATQSFDAYLEQQLGLLGPYLNPLVQSQRCLLLLDGLNETPTGLREQKGVQLKRWLQEESHRELVCYVSCRDLDYTAAMNLDLDTIRIRPLDPLRIRAFIRDYWPALTGEQGQADADKLFWELGGGEPLRQTWLAWQRAGATEQQFWFGDDIPRKNPDVYGKTKAQHDEIWRQALHNPHSLLKLAANPFMLSMLMVVYAAQEAFPENRAALFSEFVETLLTRENILEQRDSLLLGLMRLAWAMQQQTNNSDRTVQTTLPRQQALLYVDGQILLQSARANLLDAGDDVRFSHQLLQEYFTALMMREKLEKVQLDAHSCWPVGQFWEPSGWEEATVLLAGLTAPDCSAVLRWLLPVHPELLARCIREGGVPYDDSVLEELQRYWQGAWLDSKQWPQPEARASLARAFGVLGLDKRNGVGLNDQGLSDIDWIKIPPGEVVLENNKGTFPVAPFYLARYPVTNKQFQRFIDDPEGYANPRWWAELDAKPETPSMPRWTEPNHPRETVLWFEAMAFCAWLSERSGYVIKLPAEWQWQQAACSGQAGFNYPWGGEYQSGAANINESWGNAGSHDLQRTTAVGIYPQGDSLQGVSDLSGNVWEWCLNAYDEPDNTKSSGTFSRVVRGGSWVNAPASARASFRNDLSPDDRYDSVGFRVCCVSPI